MQSIIIVAWLLCWGVLLYSSYKHGLTPWDAIGDLVKRMMGIV